MLNSKLRSLITAATWVAGMVTEADSVSGSGSGTFAWEPDCFCQELVKSFREGGAIGGDCGVLALHENECLHEWDGDECVPVDHDGLEQPWCTSLAGCIGIKVHRICDDDAREEYCDNEEEAILSNCGTICESYGYGASTLKANLKEALEHGDFPLTYDPHWSFGWNETAHGEFWEPEPYGNGSYAGCIEMYCRQCELYDNSDPYLPYEDERWCDAAPDIGDFPVPVCQYDTSTVGRVHETRVPPDEQDVTSRATSDVDVRPILTVRVEPTTVRLSTSSTPTTVRLSTSSTPFAPSNRPSTMPSASPSLSPSVAALSDSSSESASDRSMIIGLVIGLGGGCCLICITIATAVFLRRRRYRGEKGDDNDLYGRQNWIAVTEMDKSMYIQSSFNDSDSGAAMLNRGSAGKSDDDASYPATQPLLDKTVVTGPAGVGSPRYDEPIDSTTGSHDSQYAVPGGSDTAGQAGGSQLMTPFYNASAPPTPHVNNENTMAPEYVQAPDYASVDYSEMQGNEYEYDPVAESKLGVLDDSYDAFEDHNGPNAVLPVSKETSDGPYDRMVDHQPASKQQSVHAPDRPATTPKDFFYSSAAVNVPAGTMPDYAAVETLRAATKIDGGSPSALSASGSDAESGYSTIGSKASSDHLMASSQEVQRSAPITAQLAI